MSRLGENPDLFVIVPEALKKIFLKHSHDDMGCGHASYDKTIDRLKRVCYWPGIYQETMIYCQKCDKCSVASTKIDHFPLIPMISSSPWDAVSIDILELPQSGNFTYLLVVQDYFTKWMVATPLADQTADNVVNNLLDTFSKFGFPRKIHSDQGRNFESLIFKRICEAFGIEKSRTTSYHPQSNGLVERANRSILNILRKIGNEYEWHKILQLVIFSYNTCKHSSTKISPFEALYGRQPRNYIWECSSKAFDYWAQLHGINLNRAKIQDMIEAEINESANREKNYYDDYNRIVYKYFPKGQMVYRKIQKKTKISPSWEKFWQVIEDKGSTVKIKNVKSDKVMWVNKNKVKHDMNFQLVEDQIQSQWTFPTRRFQEPDRYPKRFRKPPERYGQPVIDLPNMAGRDVIDNYIHARS